LADAKVGATFGNRWFQPDEPHWGALVRQLWNAPAVPLMWLFRIPWAGSFAIRSRLLRDSGLLEQWRTSMVDDAPVRSALLAQGFDLEFVPRVMMPNRESCGLPFSFEFIKRQLLWTRLYHPRWDVVLAMSVFTGAVAVLSLALVVWALCSAEWLLAAICGAGIAAYCVQMVLLRNALDTAVCRLSGRPEGAARLRASDWARLVLAVPLAHVVAAAAAVAALVCRRVLWRGVTYHIRGPWDVKMEHYRPFAATVEEVASL
jgi:hypothetical protein